MFQEAERKCGVSAPWEEFTIARREAWRDLWPRARELLGRTPSFADLVHERALRRVGVSTNVDALVRTLREEYLLPRWHRPFPESEMVLHGLRDRGQGVHLVSNNSDYLPLLLRNLGWEAKFDSVTYSQEVGVSKPNPRIFQAALDRAGKPPIEALYVGDSLRHDVEGASAAGLRSVLIDRKGLGAPPGVTTIRDLHAVLELL